MNTVHLAIARTRRRIFADTWLQTLGWMALVWVGLAALVLVADKLFALRVPVDQVWVYGSLGGVLFILAPVLASTRQPVESIAATMMDDRLGLKDSLGTALYAESIKEDPFAKQVLADAERLASKTRVNEAFPIRLGTGWSYALAGGAVCALMAVFLPEGDLLGIEGNQEQKQQQLAEAEQVQRQVLEANAILREVDTSKSELVEADPDDIYKELASITKRDLTNPDFRKEAITKLASIQEKLAVAEKNKKQEIKTAKNNMTKLDPGKRGPADRFADAMRRGDFEQAKKELQRLADGLQGMPESEKQALKDQLEAMSDQLDQMAEQQKQAQQQAQQNIQQQLQNAGLTQNQIQQLQQQGYNQQAVQQAVQQSLQNQGMNQQQAQQQAQQTAQNVSQQQQQSQNAAQSQSQCQGMGSGLGQMASSLGGSQPGQNGQNSQNNLGQQGQFSQGAWQAQQQLNQLQQMQNQLNQMQNAQQQMQQAMSQCQGMGQNQGQGMGQNPGQGQGSNSGQNQTGNPNTQNNSVGGRMGGSGGNNQVLGVERQTAPYSTSTEQDIQQGQGRVIASWQENGQMVAGEATVEFDKTMTEARNDAERAITDDRVPRRYHNAVKDYFQQMPTLDEVQKAPAAPRG